MKKHIRTLLAVVIIALTALTFGYFLAHHPSTVRTLRTLQPATLLLLIALYGVAFLAWTLVTRASLLLYGKRLALGENLLFNAYSSLINFFGPGQSGPAFRGLYLKKRHNLGVKKYVFATMLYYGMYAVLSAFMMFVGSRPWWQTLALIAVVGGSSWAAIRWYRRRSAIGGDMQFTLRTLGYIFAATVLQVSALTAVYAVELRGAGAHASLGQVLAYTGVANFSLFVSLTPGAIGIREAFLVFSHQLHHINNSVIVAANVVDRAAYLVFLGILFGLVIVLHAKDKLHLTSAKET